MDKQELIKKALFNIISKVSCTTVDHITLNDSFRDDLGLDSIDEVEVQMQVEDVFQIEVDENHLDIESVQDLLNYINENIDYSNKSIFTDIKKNKEYVSFKSTKDDRLIPLGSIVEVKSDSDCKGLRLFVAHQSKDIHNENIYSLTMDKSLVGKYVPEDTISDPVDKMIKTLENMRIFHNFKNHDLALIS